MPIKTNKQKNNWTIDNRNKENRKWKKEENITHTDSIVHFGPISGPKKPEPAKNIKRSKVFIVVVVVVLEKNKYTINFNGNDNNNNYPIKILIKSNFGIGKSKKKNK